MTTTEYGRIISKNLKRIAYESHKTQADIARDLNIKQTTLSTWMNGTRIPRMDKIDLLCHYFNCTRADIMEEHHDDEEPYYLDGDARELAEFLHKNPNYKVLFDASRNVKAEDIEFVRKMIERFSE